MAGVNKKGRTNKAGRFAALPHRVLLSSAYGSLDLTARALLLELVMIENGRNNGSLWLSVRDATDRLGLSSHHPLVRAFADLVDRDLIELTLDASFKPASESSKARSWRISWLPWPEGPAKRRAPNWDFEKYEVSIGGAALDAKAAKRSLQRAEAMKRWRKGKSENRFPVVNFTTPPPEMELREPSTVVKLTAADAESDANPPFSTVEDFTAHTDVTRGSAFSAWWLGRRQFNVTTQYLQLIDVAQNRPCSSIAA